jgi:hypothetical protein
LRPEFEDDNTLLDDIGWATDEPGDSFELTAPLDQLAGVASLLNDRSAEAVRAHMERGEDDRVAEDDAIAARHAMACSAYGRVLGRVAGLVAR